MKKLISIMFLIMASSVVYSIPTSLRWHILNKIVEVKEVTSTTNSSDLTEISWVFRDKNKIVSLYSEFDFLNMWKSAGVGSSGWVDIDFSFNKSSGISKVIVYSGINSINGISKETTLRRYENGVYTDIETDSRDIAVHVLNKNAKRSKKWRLSLQARSEGYVVIRGIRLFDENGDEITHVVNSSTPAAFSPTANSVNTSGSRKNLFTLDRVISSASESFNSSTMYQRSNLGDSGITSFEALFPNEFDLTTLYLHSGDSSGNQVRQLTVEGWTGNKYVLLEEAIIGNSDFLISIGSEEFRTDRYRFSFKSGPSGVITIRGIRLFQGQVEVFPAAASEEISFDIQANYERNTRQLDSSTNEGLYQIYNLGGVSILKIIYDHNNDNYVSENLTLVDMLKNEITNSGGSLVLPDYSSGERIKGQLKKDNTEYNSKYLAMLNWKDKALEKTRKSWNKFILHINQTYNTNYTNLRSNDAILLLLDQMGFTYIYAENSKYRCSRKAKNVGAQIIESHDIFVLLDVGSGCNNQSIGFQYRCSLQGDPYVRTSVTNLLDLADLGKVCKMAGEKALGIDQLLTHKSWLDTSEAYNEQEFNLLMLYLNFLENPPPPPPVGEGVELNPLTGEITHHDDLLIQGLVQDNDWPNHSLHLHLYAGPEGNVFQDVIGSDGASFSYVHYLQPGWTHKLVVYGIGVKTDGSFSGNNPSLAGSLVQQYVRHKRIKNKNGQCLDITGDHISNGTRVQLVDCNGTGAQKWWFRKNGRIQHDSKCLDIDLSHFADGSVVGAPVQIWECHGGANQIWSLFSTDGLFEGDETLRSAHGVCLTHHPSHGVITWHCQNNDTYKWSWDWNSD